MYIVDVYKARKKSLILYYTIKHTVGMHLHRYTEMCSINFEKHTDCQQEQNLFWMTSLGLTMARRL